MKRITLSRAKGWRLPDNTIIVDRRGFWGNPYKVIERDRQWAVVLAIPATAAPEQSEAIREAVKRAGLTLAPMIARYDTRVEALSLSLDLFETYAKIYLRPYLPQLDGRDLACWCKAADPCHAQILIRLCKE